MAVTAQENAQEIALCGYGFVTIGGRERKRPGFWQEPQTIDVVRAAADGRLNEVQAARALAVNTRDIDYYVGRLRKTGSTRRQ